MKFGSGLLLVVAVVLGACAQETLKAIPPPPPTPPLPPQEAPSTPVAVVTFAQSVDASAIAPLDRVTLDGKGSYDPRDPQDPTLIASFFWEVVTAPDGVNPSDFAFQGQGTSTLSLFLPLAGTYKVALTVTNDQDVDSLPTTSSTITFQAIPSERFLVELTWDDDRNDQDLHLVNLSLDPTVCGIDDCYFGEPTPRWYNTSPAGSGPNPTLDIDDMNGLGPENINIDAPNPSTYRIYVHYFSATGAPTTNTIKVWIDGRVAATFSRVLRPEELWAVAEIDWAAAGVATITEYPSDAPGQVGEITEFWQDDCFFAAWGF